MMSTSAPAVEKAAENRPPDAASPESTPRPIPWRDLSLVAVVVGVHVPLLFDHFSRLWSRSHYQYFPILLAVAAYFIYKRGERWAPQPPCLTRFVLLWGSVLSFTIATLLFSPWFAAISAFLATGGFLRHFLDRDAFRNVLGAWALLLLVIPLPVNLDERLVQELQRFTTRASSLFLDEMGYFHVRNGNILRVDGTEYFVEEACSGVQSLFSLLACAAIFCVWKRRPLVHSLVLLSIIPIWTCMMNLLRVVTIVAAQESYGIDLRSGAPHEITGTVLFVVALLLALSTDAFLRFLFSPIDRIETQEMMNPLCRLWNRMLGGPWKSKRALERMAKYNSYTYEGSDTDEVVAADSEARSGQTSQPAKRRPTRVPMLVVSLFICLGLVQGVAFARAIPDTHAPVTEQHGLLIEEDWLPQEINGWVQRNFRENEREASSIFGKYSRGWTYTSGAKAFNVSFDFPFSGWHELTMCYRSVGWQIVSREEFHPENQPDWNLVRVRMVNSAGEQAFLVFGLTDGFDQSYSQPRMNRLRIGLDQGALGRIMGKRPLSPVTYQFQVFANNPNELTEADEAELIDLYIELRQALYSQLQQVAQ